MQYSRADAKLCTIMEKMKQNMLNEGQNKMGVMPIGKLMFSMSVPMVISMLVQALYNVVDSYFVSQISTDALTAVSLAFPLQMLMIAVGVGTSVGMNSYMSRRLGAGAVEDANKGASNGLFLLLLSSLLFTLAGLTLVRPFFGIFSSDEHVVNMGTQYLRICCIFGLGIFIELGCERILQSMGKTGLSMITQLVGAIVNIVLDPMLIFGLWIFPELGIAGAAWATVIGQWASMAMALLLVFLGKHEVTVSFKGFRPDRRMIGEIYRVGLPSIIMQSIGSVMNVGMNTILSRLIAGGVGVAIMGVYYKMQSVIFMPLFGVTNTAMSIFAYNYGANNKSRFTKAWRLTLITAITIMVLGTLLFQLFPEQIVSVFDSEDKLAKGGATAFRIISLHFPLAACSITASVTFQAIGRGVYSMTISIIRQIGVLLPAALALALVFKTSDAVWWSFLIAETVALVIAFTCLAKLWRREITPMGDGIGTAKSESYC